MAELKEEKKSTPIGPISGSTDSVAVIRQNLKQKLSAQGYNPLYPQPKEFPTTALAWKEEDMLGAGNNGIVYKAMPVDISTGAPVKTAPSLHGLSLKKKLNGCRPQHDLLLLNSAKKSLL